MEPNASPEEKPNGIIRNSGGPIDQSVSNCDSLSESSRQAALDETLIQDDEARDDIIIYSRKCSLWMANFLAVGVFTSDAYAQLVAHVPYIAPGWALGVIAAVYGGKSINDLIARARNRLNP
jgi:hypothetical protein